MKFERTRAYTRHQRQRTMRRKMNIAKHTWGYTPEIAGIFAKGKVHCSCGMCTIKWRTEGPPASVQKWLYKINTYEE
ncbi:hypothetical protein OA45_01337 [Bacillus sp. UMTAT18]|uniref:hypothetical protein n=1 Tax=Bacillus TaxID=1386 RepID=UPI00061867D7|nr:MULTISPECIES: hypothetical protein [Bacillus]KKC55968.1 hypothetical protein OA45_01337 [Bacillus sp. UMTAT18]MDA1528984.1 hypothetical protein [Bacillus cereus group sp. TH260-2LC]OJD77246.1 hypothetical protein BAU29_04525 [Bacillus sp. P14-1]